MKYKLPYLIFPIVVTALFSCNGNSNGTNREIKNLSPYTSNVSYMKEYLDSVEIMIFHFSIEATVGVCGYQFTAHSDSIFGFRESKIISRNNLGNLSWYKTNCAKDTLYRLDYFSGNTDTLFSKEAARFKIGTTEFTVRKFQSNDYGGLTFYSDEYGLMESISKHSNNEKLRFSIKTCSFLSKKELREFQKQLRENNMYPKK